MTASYNDWTSVIVNLRKTHKKNSKMLRILVQEGVDVRTYRTFFMVLVKAVLLFGS